MSVWTVPIGITEITQQYIKDNMPAGTTEVVIPEGVKSIGDSAFQYCERLKSIVIPEGVKRIGRHAFSYCTSLASIVISEGVESVGMWGSSRATAGWSRPPVCSCTQAPPCRMAGCVSGCIARVSSGGRIARAMLGLVG